MKDITDSPNNVDRGSPKSSPSIEHDDNPFNNLSPLSLFPSSMLARQMLGGLSLHATLTANPGVYAPNWFPNPASPPPTPVNKSRRNNNNLETNGTGAKKTRKRMKSSPVDNQVVVSVLDPIPDPPLSPPTSGSSPQSNGSGKEINCKNSDKDKSFTCGACNRSFGYKHVLQNHERTHTGEKPFECRECHKRFTRDHHLKTHMRLHTGEKPYHCNYCDRQFVQVANLRRHQRVHTGERPYACNLCSSKFSDSNQLKAHMLIHKGEKPFHCESCNGNFRRRHHLHHHKCPTKKTDIYHHSPDREDMMDDMDDDSRETGLEIDEDVDSTRYSPTDYDSEYVTSKSLDYLSTPSSDNYLFSINNNRKIRERKSRDIRRVIRPDVTGPILVDPLMIPPLLPVQTEPEDLSMPKSKLRSQLTQNNNHEVSNGRRNYHSDVDSRSESPQSTSTSPSLERDKEAPFSSFYNHPKLRKDLELPKTGRAS